MDAQPQSGQDALKVLGSRLKMVDLMLVQMLVARHRLSLQVGAAKLEENKPILRPEIEMDRIAEACRLGETFGLKRDFITSIMYAVIKESCMDQLFQAETHPDGISSVKSYDSQKSNLLELTSLVAETYDREYRHNFTTAAYLAFEDEIFENLIQEMDRAERGRFVDIGCGTGGTSLRAAPLFASVVGYDLSPHMLRVAQTIRAKFAGCDVTFREADLDKGIPEDDGSASFVAATLGTGSDICNIAHVIAETRRVLRPGGRFLFSFYNRNALLYQWPFLPWQIGLSARINLEDNCLEVEVGGKIFQIFARAYTSAEVEDMFAWSHARAMRTYPTLSSVLPNGAFAVERISDISRAIVQIDRQLMYSREGAYIIVTGEKP